MRKWKNILIQAVVLSVVFFAGLDAIAEEEQAMTLEQPLTIRELPEFRITKGEVLYARYCSFCHGDTAAGDGLNAYSIPVKPRDFNDQATMAQVTDEELVRVIQGGGPSLGLSNYMPAFAHTLSAVQVEYLVGFIRTKFSIRTE